METSELSVLNGMSSSIPAHTGLRRHVELEDYRIIRLLRIIKTMGMEDTKETVPCGHSRTDTELRGSGTMLGPA